MPSLSQSTWCSSLRSTLGVVFYTNRRKTVGFSTVMVKLVVLPLGERLQVLSINGLSPRVFWSRLLVRDLGHWGKLGDIPGTFWTQTLVGVLYPVRPCHPHLHYLRGYVCIQCCMYKVSLSNSISCHVYMLTIYVMLIINFPRGLLYTVPADWTCRSLFPGLGSWLRPVSQPIFFVVYWLYS